MTSRPVPAARVQRLQDIQSRASRLASAAGARNGALLAAAPDAETDGTTNAELWLYGVVGGYWWGFNDKTVADQLRGLNVDHITVRLNSPGGDAIQGVAIGNLLRNHKATVTVVVDGLAASAASIIAIAGDEVVMSPGSQFMVHDPWFYSVGNAKELRQDADFLDKQGANMAAVYALEAGGTPEEWRAAMTAEPDGTWYSADEAVAANLADRVGTVVAVGAAPEPPAVDLDDESDMAARAAWDLEVLIPPAARSAWSYSPPTASAGGSTHTEGGPAVAFSDEQITTMRQKLGLPESADEATILAALDEALDERAEPTAAGSTTDVPEGMVLVESSVLTDLREGAQAGREARQQLATQERDRVIDAAITAGKTTPARREHWATAYDADPAGTRELLDSLEPGLAVPTAEHGHADEPEHDPYTDAALDAFASQFGLTKEALRG